MANTLHTDVFNPEILEETVRGRFGQKNAFMGSLLAQLGVVVVSGSMPEGGPDAIGTSVKVPRFGVIGEFQEDIGEDTEATIQKIRQTYEEDNITHDALAFSTSAWARGNSLVNPAVGDPYDEASNQIMEAAERQMDRRIMTKAAASGIYSKDVYSASVPRTLDYDLVVDAKTDGWGDEQEDAVAIAMHSRTYADALKLKDSTGRPLLTVSQNADTQIAMMAGLRVVVSDRLPLTNSTMGAVTSSGSSPPVATLSGTPLGPWRLHIDCTLSHASDTTIRFSTDGGHTWSEEIAAADDGTPVPLIDTAADSLVGVNGKTGISVAFASGTFDEDNLWTADAVLQVTSLLLKRRALAFWYSSGNLSLETDKNILKHAEFAAMHLYSVAHRYKRMATGTKPGVVPIVHNVGGF
jgi:hypothetical protein